MPKNSNNKPQLAHDPAEDRPTHLNKRKPHRQNVDHLLNFNLPPRVQTPAALPRRHFSSSRSNGAFRDASTIRSRFIHARYRFLMNPTGDYTAHFADPDIHHHWPNVLQVLVATTASAHAASTISEALESDNFCPVCLDEPAAPRLTKCGHIFCYPCLLHLFELSDAGKWAKCPVCGDSCHPKDLKSVAFVPLNDLEADLVNTELAAPDDQRLTLRLMERPQLTTLALPRSSTWPSDAVPHLTTPWHFSPDAYTFARFMLASPEYMMDALNKDRRQLDQRCPTVPRPDDLDGGFVQAAKAKVAEQMSKAEGLKTQAVMSSKRKSLREIQATIESTKQLQAELDRSRQPEASTSSSGGAGSSSSDDSSEELSPSQFTHSSGLSQGNASVQQSQLGQMLREQQSARNRKANLNPPPPDSATFYFYQAVSGANVFLHPLDIKVLRSHFGTYSAFPDSISVRIEGKDEGSVSEDLRRRCKYISHLPLGADVTFLEVDLEPVVGSKGVEPYAGALRMRRQKRKDRARKEDRAKIKSEEREKEQHQRNWGIRVPSAAATAISQSPPRSMVDLDNDQPAITPPSPSFLPADSNPSTRTVWGTRAVEPTHIERREDEASAEDEWHARWAQLEERAYGDRLAAATAASESVTGGGTQSAATGQQPQQQTPNGRKKGKKQRIVISIAGGGRGR